MSEFVYCVMEGGYPEGTPDGLFKTLEGAIRYIKTKRYSSTDSAIYRYTLDKEGYNLVLDFSGEEIK